MKNKILLFSFSIFFGSALFNSFAVPAYAISDSDAIKFQCNLDYSNPLTYETYKNTCCPTAPGTIPGGEPIDGKQCYSEGKVIRETSDAAVAYCADTATITNIAANVSGNNWKGFNCLRGTIDTTCRAGNYCKNDSGECQLFGGDVNNCVSVKNRIVKCDSSCGACQPNYVYCGLANNVCQKTLIGPNKPFDDTAPDTATKYPCSKTGAQADPCTGQCMCPIGYTYSGRQPSQCVPFFVRFAEIFEDGLTWLGGHPWDPDGDGIPNDFDGDGIVEMHAYDYSETGPVGLASVFLKADMAEVLNWNSKYLPPSIKWLLNNYNLCTVDKDCVKAGYRCSEGGICYNPNDGDGFACANDSDCNWLAGFVCNASGKCQIQSSEVSFTTKFVGLSTSAVNGNQGSYTGVNTICKNAYAGSHVCTSKEIIDSYLIAAPALKDVTEIAWINAGSPGNITPAVNDCNGWKNNNPDPYYGTVWNFNFKASFIQPCHNIKKFACCK